MPLALSGQKKWQQRVRELRQDLQHSSKVRAELRRCTHAAAHKTQAQGHGGSSGAAGARLHIAVPVLPQERPEFILVFVHVPYNLHDGRNAWVPHQ